MNPPPALDSLRPVKLNTGDPEASSSTVDEAFHALKLPFTAPNVYRRNCAEAGKESSDTHSRAPLSKRSICGDAQAEAPPTLGSMKYTVTAGAVGGAPITATPGPVGSPGPSAAYIFPPYTVMPRMSLSPLLLPASSRVVLATPPRTMERTPASAASGDELPAR